MLAEVIKEPWSSGSRGSYTLAYTRAEFPGWDITSFDADQHEILIEVKSSVGKAISAVNRTVNEWQAALYPVQRDRYHLYIVTSALSDKPVIERMRETYRTSKLKHFHE